MMIYGVVCFLLLNSVKSVIIEKMCSFQEVYKSCLLTDEIVCWTSSDKSERNFKMPETRTTCLSACVCETGHVREFPGGKCIEAILCKSYEEFDRDDSYSQEDSDLEAFSYEYDDSKPII